MATPKLMALVNVSNNDNIKICVICTACDIGLETVIIPAEILANGIRITINNYNKENVCES